MTKASYFCINALSLCELSVTPTFAIAAATLLPLAACFVHCLILCLLGLKPNGDAFCGDDVFRHYVKFIDRKSVVVPNFHLNKLAWMPSFYVRQQIN